MKIGKGFSLILIITFLCQNLAFCVPEGNSNLRVPISDDRTRITEVIKATTPDENNTSSQEADVLVEILLDKWLKDFKFDYGNHDDLKEARRIVFEKVRDLAYDVSPSPSSAVNVKNAEFFNGLSVSHRL